MEGVWRTVIGYDLFQSFVGNVPADTEQQQRLLIAMLNRTTERRGAQKFCGSGRFCMGIERNLIYCYGSATSCLWPSVDHWQSGDCLSDTDCLKYSTTSPKYTDGAGPGKQCPGATSWRQDACKKHDVQQILGYHGDVIAPSIRRVFEAIGAEYLKDSEKKWRCESLHSVIVLY